MLYRINEMTRPQVITLLENMPVLVLPVGATEQHGPHLPMGTDSYVAEAIAERVADTLGIGILPTLYYGYSWVWKDILGSATISQKIYEDMIVDLAQHYFRQGIKVFILINGHGANETSLKYACRRVADIRGRRMLYFTYNGAKKLFKDLIESPQWNGMVHACEVETSRMLAVCPDLVDMRKAICEYPDVPVLYGKSDITLGSLSKSGVFGDATKATMEKGNRMIGAIVESIINSVKVGLREEGII